MAYYYNAYITGLMWDPLLVAYHIVNSHLAISCSRVKVGLLENKPLLDLGHTTLLPCNHNNWLATS